MVSASALRKSHVSSSFFVVTETTQSTTTTEPTTLFVDTTQAPYFTTLLVEPIVTTLAEIFETVKPLKTNRTNLTVTPELEIPHAVKSFAWCHNNDENTVHVRELDALICFCGVSANY